MKQLIIFILLNFNCLGFSQVELSGKIVSAKDGSIPSQDIIVEIKKLSKHTWADSLGNFKFTKLDKNTKYLISFTSFQFGTLEIPFETNEMDIITKVFELKANCEYNIDSALSDWKNKKAKLLIIGSIAPLADTKLDKKFERKYKIDYFDFGCTPAPSDCIKEYNEKVFELLDKKYGKEWRKNVRKDVEYLN
ncbi:FEKKY domain-containing protein [Flavobacterium channae]|jgi:hypothetical protein|uniref:FEKKY domain-containing protein n=1 Tax=Flavobacterium channae TaxID=2897181 RepID=UPI001E43020E|nr:hypothetical protein [Flavobacterium channae]UGS24543.1 hypothetical protein LOS89_04535 [Flavobacterium channae]